MEVFYNIKEITRPRLYELHSGDVLYCNTKFIEKLGHDYNLILGENIYIINCITAKVVKVFKEKNPNKKWWQFWIKQEEIVTGYHLEII